MELAPSQGFCVADFDYKDRPGVLTNNWCGPASKQVETARLSITTMKHCRSHELGTVHEYKYKIWTNVCSKGTAVSVYVWQPDGPEVSSRRNSCIHVITIKLVYFSTRI